MNLRDQLVTLALSWQERFAVAPRVTDAVAEFDAAMLIGMSEEDYSVAMRGRSAVARGHDFAFRGVRYQVKANRPSGGRGSAVTLVAKAKNYDWDVLIWILYDRQYRLQEAWEWSVTEYRATFAQELRLSPTHMRRGKRANKAPEPTPRPVTIPAEPGIAPGRVVAHL